MWQKGDSEGVGKGMEWGLFDSKALSSAGGPAVENGSLPLVADWSPHRKRNTLSERCHNFQLESRKIPTLLWIYSEDVGAWVGGGTRLKTGMRETARPGVMETEGRTRSMEAKMEKGD